MYCKKLNVISVFLALSAFCYAQKYSGTIDKYQIFLEIENPFSDTILRANYFYNDHLKNIQLEGEVSDSIITLRKKTYTKGDKQETFQLKIIDKTLIGNWISDNKSLEVKLTSTDKDLELIKQVKLEFIRDSVQKINNKELVWLKEKYSKISMFRLGNGYTLEQRNIFNAKLDTIHYSYALNFLGCEDLYVELSIELVSQNYLCFTEHFSMYCGGAHPSHGIRTYNFDLTSKKDIDKISQIYPNLNYYKVLKTKHQNDPQIEMECDYFGTQSENNYWKYSDWVLTNEGLKIVPYFPHAMTPCRIPFTISYQELKE